MGSLGITNDYPVKSAAVLEGLKHGVSTHCTAKIGMLQVAKHNMPTTMVEKLTRSKWVAELQQCGKIMGGFQEGELSKEYFPNDVHISPIGAVVQRTKTRPIFNLSFPKHGDSVNEHVEAEWKTVSYIKFVELVSLICGFGRYSWI